MHLRAGNMLPLCRRSHVRPSTKQYCCSSFSCTFLEDTGGRRLNDFPESKEAGHGGDTAVVDEGGLVRRVKLRHPLSVRVRTATHEQSL
jgi:hypothetical protein